MENLQKVFNQFITSLREKSQFVSVIVEGKNDVAVLKRFGIKNLIPISGKNYFDLLEEIPDDTAEVVLLTDVDRQGEKIFKTLKRIFESQGLKVDGSFRKFLKKLGIEEVEQLKDLLFK